LKQIRKRVTYANVMSSLAVFLILGGATAFAAVKKIGANEIKANSIKTGKIVKEAVTAGKLKKGAVTESKLADNAVTTKKIADNAVTTNKIADNAVTTNKITDNAVTNGKIANGAVTGNKIGSGTVSKGNLTEGTLLPRAFALVEFNGEVDPRFTVGGIPNATMVGSAYCFDTPFPVLSAQATGEGDGEGNDMPSVLIAGANETFEECPPGTDVEVEMWDTGLDEETTEEFFLVLW